MTNRELTFSKRYIVTLRGPAYSSGLQMDTLCSGGATVINQPEGEITSLQTGAQNSQSFISNLRAPVEHLKGRLEWVGGRIILRRNGCKATHKTR